MTVDTTLLNVLCNMQVLIFDYDVHHGNGTNDIFYDDPNILFISTHQQGGYPGTGKLTDVGSGSGEHATINLPLPGTKLHKRFCSCDSCYKTST